ncbi:MAG: pyruvate, phosphate dikinase [bacterium]|nr:pyruvate, phosphate dikinase [bacterium]
MTKYVYSFGEGKAEGSSGMRPLLGGKGADLAEMTNIGINVPSGFTISTEVCTYYWEKGRYPKSLEEEREKAVSKLERAMGKGFSDRENPLLVSVRSGAAISMPGMMDTVLNLGLNDKTLLGLIKQTGNERMAYDAYRRFIQMFSDVVLEIDSEKFEEILSEKKKRLGLKYDNELSVDDLKDIVRKFKEIVRKEKEESFPDDPKKQLEMSIDAVFKSWGNKRAIEYRRLNKIPDDLGTAVNVQAMVFGNMGKNSGTGVAFTRNPSTGENKLYGEYLIDAQGEDVVAGIRTPSPIAKLAEEMPKSYAQFSEITQILEKHYLDVQDIEFTIENSILYILQTRRGKRTAQAAVKIAVDMVKEKLITKEEALKRIEPNQIDRLLHPQIDPKAKVKAIAQGLAASPGVGCGEVVFCADDAVTASKEGRKSLLIRRETSPDDIHGMAVAEGILTSRGGMTSHAAVVARGMGKPCVAGCEAIEVSEKKKEFIASGKKIQEGDVVTIDGGSGNVYLGKVAVVEPKITDEFALILKWADTKRRLGVRANADDPESAKKAREFGAEGIGLCRTEHMFFGKDRLPIMKEMIMADDLPERKKALNKLLPMQREDFIGMLRAMDGLPVTIRFLDPPLHEFLPSHEELNIELATLKLQDKNPKRQKELDELINKVASLREVNPMLGHRGCRLGIIYPEISEMQAQAVFEASCILKKEGLNPIPEVMIPLVSDVKEFINQKKIVDEKASEVFEKECVKVAYKVGTMIEVPRAALTAGKIAEYAEFFSFGTNDLTQTTFGFSRDDAEGKFLHKYVEDKILKENPFEVLDQEGVGELIKMAVKQGRITKPDLKVGICGEHGGEPSSVIFCDGADLNYVSCSPYRVPVARLAAAHARIKG